MQLPKYSGKENTRLLNSIGWMYIFKQGNLQNNLDSAWKFLKIAMQQAATMQDDKGFNESLCYLGLYYYKNDNKRIIRGNLKFGKFYALDTNYEHCIKNDSNIDRVHLIINVNTSFKNYINNLKI